MQSALNRNENQGDHDCMVLVLYSQLGIDNERREPMKLAAFLFAIRHSGIALLLFNHNQLANVVCSIGRREINKIGSGGYIPDSEDARGGSGYFL